MILIAKDDLMILFAMAKVAEDKSSEEYDVLKNVAVLLEEIHCAEE